MPAVMVSTTDRARRRGHLRASSWAPSTSSPSPKIGIVRRPAGSWPRRSPAKIRIASSAPRASSRKGPRQPRKAVRCASAHGHPESRPGPAACRPRRSSSSARRPGGTEATREVLMGPLPTHRRDDHPAHAARLHPFLRGPTEQPVPDRGQKHPDGEAHHSPATPGIAPQCQAQRQLSPRCARRRSTATSLPVEVLFSSAARVVGQNASGIMLMTGMGADGANHEGWGRGQLATARTEATCVVWSASGKPSPPVPKKGAYGPIADPPDRYLRSTAGMTTHRI